MEMYFLRSVACLAILLLFYKLFLEKENMHIFKRYFLLFSIVAAIIIPLCTITAFVEASPGNTDRIFFTSSEVSQGSSIFLTEYLPYLLWSIYGLGVLFFSIKFFKNLKEIILRIRLNRKIKTNRFTKVLLSEKINPHTFFNYVFLNRQKYERHEIPQEVMVHEEAHAMQKHSLDIVFVELLQILFWLNPLIYFLKQSVKLNHEFLADQAVLKKGANLSCYQKTLLLFSSGDLQSDLVNPINYSSIKKRFTVMKTRTSKKVVWVKSIVLIPLSAVLFYSFSSREIVKIETASSGSVTIHSAGDADNLNAIPQEKATPKMIAEYNKLAKFYNSQPEDYRVVSLKEFNRMRYIYGLMTDKQKKKAEKFPTNPLPPPPPVPGEPGSVQGGEIAPPPPPAPKGWIGSDTDEIPSPPTPPTPPNMKEYFKTLATEGASFYYEGKKISSEEALELVKNSKNLRIQFTITDGSAGVVQIFNKEKEE